MKYLIIFALFFTGCVTTNTTTVTKLKSYPAKSENCKMDIFTQKPGKRFKEIALLHVIGGNSEFKLHSVHSLFPDLKKKACLVGGDAIIIINFKEGSIAGPENIERASIRATVIKYME